MKFIEKLFIGSIRLNQLFQDETFALRLKFGNRYPIDSPEVGHSFILKLL